MNGRLRNWFQQPLTDVIPGMGIGPGGTSPVPAVVRLPGLVQGDKPPGVEAPIVPARPVVLSALAPSGTLPPEKTGAAPNVDVSPRGPAPAEGVATQPESVGSTEDAISLVEVAMVPLPANIEPVPSVPTPIRARTGAGRTGGVQIARRWTETSRIEFRDA